MVFCIFQTSDSVKPIDVTNTWEEGLACIIDSYLREVVLRAVAQTTIQKALRQANSAKHYMAKISFYSRLVSEWKHFKLGNSSTVTPHLAMTSFNDHSHSLPNYDCFRQLTIGRYFVIRKIHYIIQIKLILANFYTHMDSITHWATLKQYLKIFYRSLQSDY